MRRVLCELRWASTQSLKVEPQTMPEKERGVGMQGACAVAAGGLFVFKCAVGGAAVVGGGLAAVGASGARVVGSGRTAAGSKSWGMSFSPKWKK